MPPGPLTLVKGLLFFSKKATEKASPAGILKHLMSPKMYGTVDFFFTIHGHKHTFQAANIVERDNWVATLKTKVAEAKEIAESVKESETYKTSHAALVKPFSEKAEAKAEKKEEKAEAKEAKEEQKEENAEAKAEAKEERRRKRRPSSRLRRRTERAVLLLARVTSVLLSLVPSPVSERRKRRLRHQRMKWLLLHLLRNQLSPLRPLLLQLLTHQPLPRFLSPLKKPLSLLLLKRASCRRRSIPDLSHKKPEPEAASPVVAKDEEPVSENAPVIPAVDTTEPLTTDAASPVEATEAPATNGETPKAAETPTVKTDKRKSSLPWLNKKEKSATTSDEETEKPKSPFAKLRATVKSKSSPKADKTAEKPLEPTAEAKAEDKVAEESAATEATPAATEPVVSEPVTAAPTSTTPQVSATA
ncbi:hypothetical protein EYC84_004267 [Monilinia fructicola]|uniref:Meiotic expression up-regulated protein 6 PH domain-containing protein n=1 Tax=Monilinia fructicola TaxID=38448 RepID=A0A5M9K2K6_MONFR|nr:hypothetical protein EYC84_004267 [Monilinia fructicola]